MEDEGQLQVEALKDLKPKAINDKSEEKNSLPRSAVIFNYLRERKKIMSELYDSVDQNNLNFEYVSPTKSVSFYGYMDSKEQIRFNEVKNKQNDFLKKLNEVKIGKITDEQKQGLIILISFTVLEKKLLIFLETILKCYPMLITMQNKLKLREQNLKY